MSVIDPDLQNIRVVKFPWQATVIKWCFMINAVLLGLIAVLGFLFSGNALLVIVGLVVLVFVYFLIKAFFAISNGEKWPIRWGALLGMGSLYRVGESSQVLAMILGIFWIYLFIACWSHDYFEHG